MAISFPTESSLNFQDLVDKINFGEKKVFMRLTNLKGIEENGGSFNLHTYESVDDNTLPFSNLFIISGGGSAAADPVVKTWLEQNPNQQIRSDELVYVSNSLIKIAVVR